MKSNLTVLLSLPSHYLCADEKSFVCAAT